MKTIRIPIECTAAEARELLEQALLAGGGGVDDDAGRREQIENSHVRASPLCAGVPPRSPCANAGRRRGGDR